MNGIIKKATEKTNSEIKSQVSKIQRLADGFVSFSAFSFKDRDSVLDVIRQHFQNEGRPVSGFVISIKSLFLDEHIRLTVQEIRAKYGIAGKPTEKDFYRICASENIGVVNREQNDLAKKIKHACYYTVGEHPFIKFEENPNKSVRLRGQFHLLGNHFLHRDQLPTIDELPTVNAISSELVEIADTRKEEAALFAIEFVDFKPEVKND